MNISPRERAVAGRGTAQCMKHRARHFPLAWRSPCPCRTQSPYWGRFARGETLKRHLTFSRFARCTGRDVVLQLLGLESIPASGRGSCGGMAWMAPLREGLERPCERPGFQFADLETVKA
jgi:hypothetical protein